MKITANFDDLRPMAQKVAGIDYRARQAITFAMQATGSEMTAYMKNNAPWQDDTGRARQGLFVTFEHPNRDAWELIAAHSVEYGIYLETKWMGTGDFGWGKYAIVMPTIERFKPILFSRLEGLLTRVANEMGAPASFVSEFMESVNFE